jgi:HK97 gp10 family phage protein
MADELQMKLDGLDELKRALAGLPPKIRTRAVRNALKAGARLIQAAARQAAPVLAVPTKTRTPGTVQRRIAVRASKFARQAGDEGVFVGVKPLRGKADTRRYGKASAKNPHDPYYWRFLEFGTKKMPRRPFLDPAVASQGQAAIARFMAEAVPQIEKLNVKEGA